MGIKRLTRHLMLTHRFPNDGGSPRHTNAISQATSNQHEFLMPLAHGPVSHDCLYAGQKLQLTQAHRHPTAQHHQVGVIKVLHVGEAGTQRLHHVIQNAEGEPVALSGCLKHRLGCD